MGEGRAIDVFGTPEQLKRRHCGGFVIGLTLDSSVDFVGVRLCTEVHGVRHPSSPEFNRHFNH